MSHRQQNEIGDASRFQCGAVGFAGRVDQQKLGPVVLGRLHGLFETADRGRDDGRVVVAAAVLPVGGVGLRIEVDDDGGKPGMGGGHGKADPGRGFAGTAFLTQDGNAKHVRFSRCKHVKH